MIYTTRRFQNPTGHTLTVNDRRELLKLAPRYRVPIIEERRLSRPLSRRAAAALGCGSSTEYNLVIYLEYVSKNLARGCGWLGSPRAK